MIVYNRKCKGLTQVELASALGYEWETICDAERNIRLSDNLKKRLKELDPVSFADVLPTCDN